ncbi:MAG: hypothetical protein ABUL44_04770, partial [Flavobacterium sp.]
MTVESLIEKVNDFDSLTQKEKVKNVSYFFCLAHNTEVFNSSDVIKIFDKLNLEIPSNVSRELASLASSKPPILVKKASGYSFQRNFKKQLDEIYCSNKHSKEVSIALRNLISNVNTKEQGKFLEEAISCFEFKLFRAAIIMAWLLTMDLIYERILNYYLQEFNEELKKRNKKKFISSKSDFEEYRESETIEILKVLGGISKEQRKILDEKLDIRNSAAHPNSTLFREPKVITYIQEL